MTGTWKIVSARKIDELRTKTGAKKMTHSPDFPPSPEYLARQAAWQGKLNELLQRQKWTCRDFLDDRDAKYVEEQRRLLPYLIKDIERSMNDDGDTLGSVRHYGTDEG
jgi:hypothetical protein